MVMAGCLHGFLQAHINKNPSGVSSPAPDEASHSDTTSAGLRLTEAYAILACLSSAAFERAPSLPADPLQLVREWLQVGHGYGPIACVNMARYQEH